MKYILTTNNKIKITTHFYKISICIIKNYEQNQKPHRASIAKNCITLIIIVYLFTLY